MASHPTWVRELKLTVPACKDFRPLSSTLITRLLQRV